MMIGKLVQAIEVRTHFRKSGDARFQSILWAKESQTRLREPHLAVQNGFQFKTHLLPIQITTSERTIQGNEDWHTKDNISPQPQVGYII